MVVIFPLKRFWMLSFKRKREARKAKVAPMLLANFYPLLKRGGGSERLHYDGCL